MKMRIPKFLNLHTVEQSNLSPTMQFSALLITLLASMTITMALPTGLSFSEDLKTAIAQKRTQEHDLAASNSLSDEKRAYQLETVTVAASKDERDIDPNVLESRSAQSPQPGGKAKRGGKSLRPGL